VPSGSARLRVSITWKRTMAELDRLAETLLLEERRRHG
jgi:7-keto-8-aminopelargonate synthetase-like enzyme